MNSKNERPLLALTVILAAATGAGAILMTQIANGAEPSEAGTTRRGTCPEYSSCLQPSVGVIRNTPHDADDFEDAVPSDVVETNSDAIFVPFVFDPDGTDDDTGTEVCDAVGMDCVDVIRLDTYAASTCAADHTGQVAMAFCK